jgi:hypothetical protein
MTPAQYRAKYRRPEMDRLQEHVFHPDDWPKLIAWMEENRVSWCGQKIDDVPKREMFGKGKQCNWLLLDRRGELLIWRDLGFPSIEDAVQDLKTNWSHVGSDLLVNPSIMTPIVRMVKMDF